MTLRYAQKLWMYVQIIAQSTFMATRGLDTTYPTPPNFRVCAQLNALEKRFKIWHILYIRKPKVALGFRIYKVCQIVKSFSRALS